MPDFKKKAGAVANAAAGRARSFALFAAKKTKNVSRIAKLNVDIASERDSIKRAYKEIGKLYYETHRDAPEGFFVRLCQDIDHSMESIASMEAEIVRLKTEEGETPDAESDFAAAVDENAAAQPPTEPTEDTEP